MKRLFNLLLSIGVIGSTVGANASPLVRKDVSADPALLFHIDFDAVRASTLGKALLDQVEQSDLQNKLAALQAVFNFDIRKQLHGLTLYTTAEHPKEGVLIVYADADTDRLLTLARTATAFETITNGSHQIYTWVDEKKKDANGEPPHVYAAIAGKRIVFGQYESRLAAALDVLDGGSPNLAGVTGPAELAAGETVFAQGAVRKFDFDNGDPNAAVFRMSKVVRLQLGEADGKVAAHVSFEAKDADTATQIQLIAQGLVAIVRLQKENPDALKLANAISLKQDDATVVLTAAMPSNDLLVMIKNAAARKAGKESASATNSPAKSP